MRALREAPRLAAATAGAIVLILVLAALTGGAIAGGDTPDGDQASSQPHGELHAAPRGETAVRPDLDRTLAALATARQTTARLSSALRRTRHARDRWRTRARRAEHALRRAHHRRSQRGMQ